MGRSHSTISRHGRTESRGWNANHNRPRAEQCPMLEKPRSHSCMIQRVIFPGERDVRLSASDNIHPLAILSMIKTSNFQGGQQPPQPFAHEPLLNCRELAGAMSVSAYFITAMRSAGYRFAYGHQTTLSHALNWRADHPDFRTTGYAMRLTPRAHRIRRTGSQ